MVDILLLTPSLYFTTLHPTTLHSTSLHVSTIHFFPYLTMLSTAKLNTPSNLLVNIELDLCFML